MHAELVVKHFSVTPDYVFSLSEILTGWSVSFISLTFSGFALVLYYIP